MGKGEIVRNEQFLLYPQCFLLKQVILSPFVHIFAIISLFAAQLEEPKIWIPDKGLKQWIALYMWSLTQVLTGCSPQISFKLIVD